MMQPHQLLPILRLIELGFTSREELNRSYNQIAFEAIVKQAIAKEKEAFEQAEEAAVAEIKAAQLAIGKQFPNGGQLIIRASYKQHGTREGVIAEMKELKPSLAAHGWLQGAYSEFFKIFGR